MRITTQRAQIQIRTQKAQISIERPKPRMHIHTRKARMKIERRNPSFKIVREPIRVDTMLRRMPGTDYAQYVDASYGANNSARRAQRSLEDGALLDGLDAIADQTMERASRRPSVAESRPPVAEAPRSRIEWDVGNVSIDWEPYEMIIEWDMTGEGPKITLNPHSVEIKLSRYPSIKVTFSAEYFERIGKKKIDEKI